MLCASWRRLTRKSILVLLALRPESEWRLGAGIGDGLLIASSHRRGAYWGRSTLFKVPGETVRRVCAAASRHLPQDPVMKAIS
jgi:hypothetical protein